MLLYMTFRVCLIHMHAHSAEMIYKLNKAQRFIYTTSSVACVPTSRGSLLKSV